MEQDRIQKIKDAYRGVNDNLVTLWNARLDLLADNREALEELLENTGTDVSLAKNTGCNAIAGCGTTNNAVGCGPLNGASGCGPPNIAC